MNVTVECRLKWSAVLLLLGFMSLPALAEVRTNWVERWVTNTLEVYVPANRFVTEYHSTLVSRATTNVVNVYSTNHITRHATNLVRVDLVRTNFVHAYQTNYKTLNLTNWTTVLVLKTNWVQQTVTNVAEVEVARPEGASNPVRENQKSTAATPGSDEIVIEAARGPKLTPASQPDVLLSFRCGSQPKSSVRVLQWRVQSEEGSILCFGQEADFHRALPLGTYKVELKAQSESKKQPVTARATLVVSTREVRIAEQRPLAQR